MSQGDTDSRWPCFKMVKYTRPTSIPNGWDEELLEKGAPDGIMVKAAKELTILEDPGSGPLVCFGGIGSVDVGDVRLCLDPRTKRVVSIVYGRFRPGQTHPEVLAGTTGFVNSSLDQFLASVRVVTERFPYDSWRPDEVLTFRDRREEDAYVDKLFAEWDNACHEITEMLREIDPALVEDPDNFWMGLIEDVRIGDYSTEDILRPRDH